jgi:hypothetical protein
MGPEDDLYLTNVTCVMKVYVFKQASLCKILIVSSKILKSLAIKKCKISSTDFFIYRPCIYPGGIRSQDSLFQSQSTKVNTLVNKLVPREINVDM